jgi:hypothetical protein
MSDNGKKVVRLTAAPAEAVLEKYGHLLGDADAIDAGAPPSIPAAELAALRRAVSARLAPAARVDVATAVMVLAGSFKLGSAVEDPEIFVSGMIEELSDYPVDILEAAVRSARRTLRLLPAIADMVEICESLVAERRMQLRALERIEAQARPQPGADA